MFPNKFGNIVVVEKCFLMFSKQGKTKGANNISHQCLVFPRPQLAGYFRNNLVPLQPVETEFLQFQVTFLIFLLQLRFSDTKDSLLLAVGVLGCFLYGIITPGQFIVLGGFTQDIVDYSICMTRNCSDPLDLEDSATTVSYWYIGLAAANFFFAWLGIGLFGYSAERQTHKMRLALFRNVIHQEIGWFDSHSSGEILSRLSEYVLVFLFFYDQ